ncbi:hypothetical protein PIB30_071660 [Stylosanthes scabra]|uniref:Uncharacterized protein n=1 Tax=Stylosanthes scabra TaxID=79078 RepID=A0ABU6RPA4_9FABA|nr:hypothetical protein [Stylosanthes scabra]
MWSLVRLNEVMGVVLVLGCSVRWTKPPMCKLSLESRTQEIDSNPSESTRLRSFLFQMFSKSFDSTLKGFRVDSYMDRNEFGLKTLQRVDLDEFESTPPLKMSFPKVM